MTSEVSFSECVAGCWPEVENVVEARGLSVAVIAGGMVTVSGGA